MKGHDDGTKDARDDEDKGGKLRGGPALRNVVHRVLHASVGRLATARRDFPDNRDPVSAALHGKIWP